VCEVQVNDSQRILRRFNDTSHLVASLRAT
jgi:hypothetical protein